MSLRSCGLLLRSIEIGKIDSVRVDAELQRPCTDKGNGVAMTAPVGGFRQGGDEVVVGLRLVRRAGALLHLPGHEDHGIAGDRELALAALAPEFQHDFAVVADIEVRYAL